MNISLNKDLFFDGEKVLIDIDIYNETKTNTFLFIIELKIKLSKTHRIGKCDLMKNKPKLFALNVITTKCLITK